MLSELLFVIEASALAVEIQPPCPAICRDPKNDFLLALCKKGKVDFLVTGDKDLLVMLKQGPTEVITPREFSERLK
ncbi:MAG: putative toxin-antitoxin system toxin component, PIN family [Flavobacteriales bacterium]|nr:putative toxin-antitoxin system toxin component, PIN family [Flavobacteriales bacterium]